MAEISLRWIDKHLFTSHDSNGHSIVIGRSPEDDQVWLGVKPSDLLLMAAAACSAFDLIDILSKQRQPLEDLKVICAGEQRTEPPYTFTSIHLKYEVFGAVDPQKLERAIYLSEEKYCSVLSTLRPGVPITSEYSIHAS